MFNSKLVVFYNNRFLVEVLVVVHIQTIVVISVVLIALL